MVHLFINKIEYSEKTSFSFKYYNCEHAKIGIQNPQGQKYIEQF